ncbi:MAG TPA: NotI family restriction endonuclease [Blastocatellia bacterium]|nr:NotI family restriction endonuclease [Blastocatellia bacterium]
MPKNPLAEVFGYPAGNISPEAIAHRQGRLCPYHNSSGLNCTKNSATDPLGVCTVIDGNDLAITCPVRLRQNLMIVSDAAGFFFPEAGRYVALTEARLNDNRGKSAGNIDIVIVELDEAGKVRDFGALEVQAVYISGNVSKAFKKYMEDPATNYEMEWPAKNYPKPDYLSSSRKRLAPQLIYKGGILNGWGKKTAVAVHRAFFTQLPAMPEVDLSEAEIAWLIYDLKYDEATGRYQLERCHPKYTRFSDALATITTPQPGDIRDFEKYLSDRISKGRIMGAPSPAELAPEVEPMPEVFDESAGELKNNR